MTVYKDENELIEVAKSNPEAFGVLYERYVTKIYTYIYYRTGNQEDAEDLTARVFHKALSHISSYKDRGHPFLLGCTGLRIIRWQTGIAIKKNKIRLRLMI